MGRLSTTELDERTEESRLDLKKFVKNISYLRHIIKPFSIFYDWLMICFRWRHPKLNMFILLLMNGIWFQTSTLSLVILLMTIWGFSLFIALKTDILCNVFPDSYSMDFKEAKSEVFAEFHNSIIYINVAVIHITDFVISGYKIFRWEDTHKSLKAYMGLLVCGSAIYFSVSFSFLILLNIFLLHNLPLFLYPSNDIILGFSLDDVFIENPEIVHKTGSHDLSSTLEEPVLTLEEINSELPKVVSTQQTDSGSIKEWIPWKNLKGTQAERYCHGCETTFGYIMKKRHYCRHCGDHFCWNCCNQYVPRYFFGATAPAAKTETVMVCLQCYRHLNDKFASNEQLGDNDPTMEKTS